MSSSVAQGFSEIAASVASKFSPVGFAAMAFKKHRVEYYEYMADLMANSGGRRNLLDMFKADATRYAGKPRGVLAAYWAERYEDNGADLAKTWEGTLPDADLMVIRVAQNSGGAAMEQALRDVARVTGIVDKAKSEFVSTVAVGALGVAMAVGILVALPLFLVPSLKDAFGFIPLDKWGSLGKGLLSLSNNVVDYGGIALCALIAAIAWTAWSLQNFVHPFRKWLDNHILIYKLYRDFRGAMFMATAASMVRRRAGTSGLRLQDALVELGEAAEPWLRWHCDQIVENINQSGGQGPEVFDTGILDQEVLYYLLDMVETKGFDEGLQRAGARTEQRAVLVVGRRAAVLRWVLLIIGLVTVMVVGGWAMAVIFEMKKVIMSTLGS